jgi:hypothetical protein
METPPPQPLIAHRLHDEGLADCQMALSASPCYFRQDYKVPTRTQTLIILSNV